ncbi:MAG: S8 family serine peptidase [Maribacter sp.]|uniref:S8 family serine peptidase n=1 Tax=Maribacter sp. TaxID=1897614 RepID=UPI003C71748B
MKHNYYVSNRTHSPIQTTNSANWRLHLAMLFSLFFILVGYAQKGKGKGGPKGNNQDISLSICVQEMENGLTKAWFGYTNPNDNEIILPEGDSYVYLSDKIDDSEYQGVEKFNVLNTFEPGTVEKAFSVVFNGNGHAKWTIVQNGNSETKIRAAADSPVCEEACIVCPVYGGVGKIYTPIGSELTALGTNTAGDLPSELIFQLNTEEEVLIEIVPASGNIQAVLDLLQLAEPTGFGRTLSHFIVDPAIIEAKYATIDVYFPINRLLELNDYGDGTIDTIINFARPLYLPSLAAGTVDSQGDAAMLTNDVRESFSAGREEDGSRIPVDGRGIKIGVISDSYDKVNPGEADLDVDQSDLPGLENDEGNLTPVDIIKDLPGKGSDEGRAMMQIIHDVAPGAKLGFYTGVLSPRDLALGIEIMSNDDYMIITDDVTYPLEPFFGDGEIAEAIKDFTDKPGRAYVTSSGNFADNAQQGVFTNSSSSVVPDFLVAGTVAHVFGTNPDGSQDISNKISLEPGTYMFVLQWDEPQASQNFNNTTPTDLDIYLITDTGEKIVDTNRDNELGDSVEAMLFQATTNATANIMITSANGPAPANLAFRYIVFKSNGLEYLEYEVGAPTVSGHAMTDAAVTVGAVFHGLAQNPSPEAFSSYAGVLSNNVALKVDISAPDGVDINNITNFGTDTDGNGFNNFFGTSAAAPHAAATFGLLMSAIPTWYPGGLPQDLIADLGLVVEDTSNVLGDQALALLKSAAIPSGIPEQSGIGLINAVAALQKIARQTAILTKIEVPEEKKDSLSIVPVQVTLIGKYIPEEPKVFLGEGDSQIELEIISSDDTEIVVMVPPFVGNPNALINTISITDTGDDGGNSNPLPIIEDGRIAVKIYADTLAIEYGQSYQFSYTADGLPEGIEFGDELPPIKLASPADARAPFPDVTNYTITPEFDMTYATAEQLANLDGYLINFVNGLLRVTKKDLAITPESQEITYGDAVNVQLNYDFINDGIEDGDLFLQTIINAHNDDFFEENTLILINKSRAVINQEQILDLLNGGSWFASERVIQNKSRAVINSETSKMNLLDLDEQNFINYFDIEPIGNKSRAVINKSRAVINGQDLLNDQIELYDPISNKSRAVINGTGILNQNGFEDFASIFAVVDFEDGTPEGEEERTVDKVYAANLLTGLDVNVGEEPSLIFPGAFLSNLSNNFSIEYGSANITVSPATLTAAIEDLEIIYGTTLTIEDINAIIDGYVYEETSETVFPDGIPFYFVDVMDSGQEFELGELLNVGTYEIRIKAPQNYSVEYERVGSLEIFKKTLTFSADPMEINYGQILTSDDIISVIDGYAYDETSESVFPIGIPYYFVDAENNEFEVGAQFELGSYFIRIREPHSYVIEYGNLSTLSVIEARLTAEIGDLVIDQGATIDTAAITASITGYVYNETEEEVFPMGLQYSIEDVEGNPYTPGATGVYFIKIMEPQNYVIEYNRIGTVYINPINNLRKIRTYTDCVEDNPGDPDGLFYIAHFRYVNPNDEAIYILVGPENRLTGPAQNSGELPIKFLPGEHTFEIRFDGTTLKWELTSMDSNHKSSTTSRVNSKSNKCDSNNTTNDSGISSYILYPNPVNGILYIEQDISAMVTLDVFDLYGMLITSLSNTTLDGTIAPTTHSIDMSGLKEGMYFIRLSNNDDVQVFSVVKE